MTKQYNQNSGIIVHTNPFKYMYYEYKDVLVKETDMLQNDVTEVLYQYVDECVEFGEPCNIAIKGDVGGSKSTIAQVLMHRMNTKIEKKHNKKIDRYECIKSDQTEFIRFIASGEWDKCIVIDEFSRIADTGLNASTESVLFDHYSDVFAQRRIHRIACSPSRILDKNASVILEYIGKNEEEKVSKFKVMYRNVAEGYNLMTLGYVMIYVGDVIETNWYKKYRAKKFARMELIDKHGVRDIRELEFADIIIRVVEDLRDTVKDGSKMELSDMIQAVISRVCRENKKIYSLLTTNEIASRVRNILGLHAVAYKTEIKLAKCKDCTERQALLDKLKKVKTILQTEMSEEIKRRDLYEEYLNIK